MITYVQDVRKIYLFYQHVWLYNVLSCYRGVWTPDDIRDIRVFEDDGCSHDANDLKRFCGKRRSDKVLEMYRQVGRIELSSQYCDRDARMNCYSRWNHSMTVHSTGTRASFRHDRHKDHLSYYRLDLCGDHVTPSKGAVSNFVHLQQHRHNGVTGNGRLTTHNFFLLLIFNFFL